MSLKSLLILNEKTDLVDTPEAGKIHLFLNGNTLKYKNSTGGEFVLATGVSQEEAEDIVANLLTDGNGIDINYDDSNNQLTISVDESQINHQSLVGVGTNTHIQIDSHIGSTGNPHSVTKAQVGLGNVDNTSDANKPVSTATQTALNLKYDASNPNGYETPTQLNSRDTNNRNRANHTGTQLSNTISNFSNSVLSTLLTGYSIGANLALLATDSVLVALGKLQAQINAIVGSLVRGDNFQYFEDLTTATTTSNTYSDAASFTTTTKQTGNYRISCQVRFSAHATNNDFLFRLLVDGVQVGAEIAEESQDSNSQGNVRHIWGYVDFPIEATHTIAVQFRTENNASGTLSCSQVYVEMWRR